MNKIHIPVGVSGFSEIRKEGYYYIDKSGLIQKLLTDKPAKVTLITRPSRFGKTLGMSMLSEFFDIRKSSAELFEGLRITEDQELCAHWRNQWPVLFITLKDIGGLNFEKAFAMLRSELSELCKQHFYLLDSPRVSEIDKKIFLEIADTVDGRPSDEQVKGGIRLVMHMMQAYYEKPVILLIDEYDVPLAKASAGGYYGEMVDTVAALMSTALKDNGALKFAVITGCLRISKESIFTGVNNFISDTIFNDRFDEYFGFTEQEMKKILTDSQLEAYGKIMQTWYDGYRFGSVDVYCPWDVLCYVYKLMGEKDKRPENFWENTSHNDIIRTFLSCEQIDVTEQLETLLSGGYVKTRIEANLTYEDLTSSEENLWSVLYFTGYLTRLEDGLCPEDCDSQDPWLVALRIPNEEVKDIFRRHILRWFNEKTAEGDRSELFAAFWAGEADVLTDLVSSALFTTISYHDYLESFYRAFLAGLFSYAGYIVESNYENGLGRADLVVKDKKNRRAAVIEAKITNGESHMEDGCRKALEQIERQQYAGKLERDGYKHVLQYGIAFYKKKCLVSTR